MVGRKSWGDVVRIGVLDGLSALRDEQAVPIALEHLALRSPGARAARSALRASNPR